MLVFWSILKVDVFLEFSKISSSSQKNCIRTFLSTKFNLKITSKTSFDENLIRSFLLLLEKISRGANLTLVMGGEIKDVANISDFLLPSFQTPSFCYLLT